MKVFFTCICIALTIVACLGAQNVNWSNRPGAADSVGMAVGKGAQWLASVQGADGGWGQDGGETCMRGLPEHLESNGNDVANTAVAALALLQAGKQYRPNVDRALDFILAKVEASPADGLAITDGRGTRVQRKLGPYIDTFLTSRLLAQVDGTLANHNRNARIRRALEKCVAKIEKNQKSDGSWNIAGGWAPVLGTSLASRSLFEAQQKGGNSKDGVMAKAEQYTVDAIQVQPVSSTGRGGSYAAVAGGVSRQSATAESAGVPLYQSAQALEQLSRTEADRKKNAPQIKQIQAQLLATHDSSKDSARSAVKNSFHISTSATD